MLNLIILKIDGYFYLTLTVTHNVNYKTKKQKKMLAFNFLCFDIIYKLLIHWLSLKC